MCPDNTGPTVTYIYIWPAVCVGLIFVYVQLILVHNNY